MLTLLPASYHKKLAFLLLGVLCVRALNIMPTIIIGEIVDLINQINAYFYQLLVGLVGLALAQPLINPWQEKHLGKLVLEANRDLSVDWTQRILHKSFRFFGRTHVGKILRQSERAIIAHERFLQLLISQALPSLIELFCIAIYFIYIANFAAILLLVASAFFFVLLSIKGITWRRPHIEAVNLAEDTISEHFASVFQAAKSIKLFGAWKSGVKTLEAAYNEYAKKAQCLSVISSRLKSSQLSTIALTQAAVLILSITLQKYSSGTLVVTFLYAGLFMDRMLSLATIYRELDQFRADQQAIGGILALPNFREKSADTPLSSFNLTIHPFVVGKIKNPAAIHIPYGTHVAIIGITGGGKTTLAHALSGISELKNTLYLADQDISQLSEETLVKTIAYALQEPEFLLGNFDQSVLLDHILLSDQSLERFIYALRLDKVMAATKRGDVLPIHRLSGGELKRLSLLRVMALLKPITIIDEPTSAMDNQTAQIVWSTLFKYYQGRTLICITHDESILENIDMVIALRDHQVVVEKMSY